MQIPVSRPVLSPAERGNGPGSWLLVSLGFRVAEQLGERKNSVWLRGVSARVAWLVSRTFSQAVGVCCLQSARDSLWIKALCCPLELLLTPLSHGTHRNAGLRAPPSLTSCHRLHAHVAQNVFLCFTFFLPSSPPFSLLKTNSFYFV